MAGLPDRGIRGSLEDAQDGSRACRSTQGAGGGADAAGGRPRVGVGAGHRPQVPGAGGSHAEIGGRASARPVWDAVAGRVQALLAESVRWTGGKQRLTATRLHELLVAEGHRVGVTVVKDAVAEWKRQRREVFVPLTYRPGDLAEVDFFEVLVDVDGTRRKAWLFLMRLMYSGRDFAWIYERQDQISFLDGHVRAFAHFEGVPARVAYDNLRAAVVRILVGGARTLTPRFTALASHYLLEAVSVGPARATIRAASSRAARPCGSRRSCRSRSARRSRSSTTALLAQMDARLDTTRDAAGQTIGVRFAEEQRLFRPAPLPFAAEATTFATVSPRALVRLEGAVYSVPCRWAGLDLVVRIGADDGDHRRARGDAASSIRGSGSGSGRLTIGITSRSSRGSRRPCARCCRICCGISATRFRRSGISCTRRTVRVRPRGSSPRCSGSSRPYGAAVVVPALTAALATGTPLLLALTPARSTPACVALDAVPAPLRDIAVTSGCAADYDGWLRGGAA